MHFMNLSIAKARLLTNQDTVIEAKVRQVPFLTACVPTGRRDCNHPSVIMWTIGNEIDYRNDPFTHPILGNEYRPGNPPAQDLVKCPRPLIAAVKRLDATRPVTAALATVTMSDAVGFAEMLDTVGYNSVILPR